MLQNDFNFQANVFFGSFPNSYFHFPNFSLLLFEPRFNGSDLGKEQQWVEDLRQEVISRYTQLVEFCAKVSHCGEDMMTCGERNAFFNLGEYTWYWETG